MSRSFIRMMAVLALLVVSQATGTLAGTTGSIDGTVTDKAGHPIAAAQIAAVAPSYATKTVTGSNGFYAVSGLPPDTYAVTFSKEGYQTQTVRGITINQDQVYKQDITLTPDIKTIGRVSVRGSTAIVQPTQTVNQYTVNSQTIDNILGVPQNISETALLNSLPGVTTDNGGGAIIRGGAANETGFEFEGIDATEPVTGQFINSLALNGVSRLQLSTGGYDVSEGNTNSGVVNVVAKRGAYPGSGEATASIGWRAFNHPLSFDYGGASPDNRVSYYFSYNGGQLDLLYGDGTTILPRLQGATSNESGSDFLTNLYYHWGASSQNELQYFGDAGSNLFNTAYQTDTSITPYATFNQVVTQVVAGQGSGLFSDPAVSMVDFAPLFPGQVGINQFTRYPDHEDENHQIQKVNFKHQFNPSSFTEFNVFRTQSVVNFLTPWNAGALTDQFEYVGSDNRGLAFDYNNQVDSKNDVSFGGETIVTHPFFSIGIPSSTMFTGPLECGRACADLGLTGVFNPAVPGGIPTGVCAGLPPPVNGFSYVQPLYNQIAQCYGLPAMTVPLSQLPDNTSHITDNIHRSNLWLKDRWTPTSRLTATAGIRWDQEILDLPADRAAQNLSYFTNSAGNFIDLPGQPLGTDVTRPSQVSPRIALAYEAGPRDAFKASYGTFIEFTPLSNIENTYHVEATAQNCTLANGCFHALPGYSPTCVNGVDAGGVPCNGISNLKQQIIEDLNTHNFAQFTPVKPQRAFSADFSWEHDFGNGLQLKITPYYRKGQDYVVASTPLLFSLPDGTQVFGSPRESNAGVNKNTGVELAIDKFATYGWSGFINATYDNTLANYNSDFFPSINTAALSLAHFFHVTYLSPITATLNLNYITRSGWHLNGTLPYFSGYRYGNGTHTFIFLPTGPSGALVAHEVLNTDLAEAALGNTVASSAYYYTDPSNRGTILQPNITGSVGTNEGPDPGTLRGPQRVYANFTIARDFGIGQKKLQVGLRVLNAFGNYTNRVIAANSRYRNNGIGGYGFGSGNTSTLTTCTPSPNAPVCATGEPYHYNRSPFPFNNEATGAARTYLIYFNARY